jgi:carbon monoxide dehydrogenase subunit G
MIDVERTFEVRQPVSAVVDYLKDFAHAEEWDPGTKSCTRTDSGPIQVGSTWHNVSEFKGKDTELEYRLTELTAVLLTFQGENKTATSIDTISVQATDTGSAITYHAQIEFHGLAKLATPFLKSEFEELGDKTVEQMTNVLNGLS